MLNIWKGLKGGKGREIYGNYVIISKTFKRLKINMQEFLPFHISTFTTTLGKKYHGIGIKIIHSSINIYIKCHTTKANMFFTKR